jgi:hypothetical protein
MMKLVARLGGLTALLALLSTSAYADTRVFVHIGPPAPVYGPVVVGPPPAYGYVWQPGYYAWTGGYYQWVPARWARPPYRHARWMEGRWRHEHRGWYWTPGHWRR